MRFALVNPNWTYEGSIFFGCRQPHLPLEFGYAKALLERAGHEVLLLDGQLEALSPVALRARVRAFGPDCTVLTSAPSYLAWGCPPPELRVPMEVADELRDVGGRFIAVGPHASTTPQATLKKLGVDLVVRGECESVLAELAAREPADWTAVEGVAYHRRATGEFVLVGPPRVSQMELLPALHWPRGLLERHRHHHGVAGNVAGLAAEMEVSRGCLYDCAFCANSDFRNQYRRRPLEIILEELDSLLADGVRYVFFIDETFLPWPELLEALAERPFQFGVQTRIELWRPRMLELLGRAGCVALTAGIESISEEGRQRLGKASNYSTPELTGRLIQARRHIAGVEAHLLDARLDPPEAIEAWRGQLKRHGVRVGRPMPLFPYPGSQEYARRWGEPDEQAWERALDDYLAAQGPAAPRGDPPLPLAHLEMDTHYA